MNGEIQKVYIKRKENNRKCKKKKMSKNRISQGGATLAVIPSTNKISKYDYHNISILYILTKFV